MLTPSRYSSAFSVDNLQCGLGTTYDNGGLLSEFFRHWIHNFG